MRIKLYIIAFLFSLGLSQQDLIAQKDATIPVSVQMNEDGSYQLMRGGEPYYIKGAGGNVYMDKIVEAGGNSLRLWGVENAGEILDEAHKLGLTVMLGFWMQHERHGFDYSDEWAVKDQFYAFRDVVRKYKDHPALLMWGVGNEMDLFYTDFNVWDAVEEIAAMIKEEDPQHPSCVVTAGIDVAEVQMIQERAPSIDILGVNTYGDLPSLADKIKLFGWTGPYIVTEWGPNGHWEVQKTSWGAPIEQTSTEKAEVYKERYEKHIQAHKDQCLGSYVFHWGNKQETTSTWYGMFLNDGSETATVDVMYDVWKGSGPANRSPLLKSFTINGKTKNESLVLSPRSKNEVKMELEDESKLKIKWEVLPESTDIKAGGDKESKPDPIPGLIKSSDQNSAVLKAPGRPGAYRLFLFAYDEEGKVATANFPFLVE